MKPKSTFRLGAVALLGSCALLMASLQASADPFSLSQCGVGSGSPSQFSNLAIFTLNAASGDTDVFGDNSQVLGDVAVAGSGKITMNNFAKIKGNLSYKTNGTLTKASTATITGSIFKNSSTDSLLTAGASVAQAASDLVNSLNASSGYPTTINSNTSLSLSNNGLAVLKLTDFKLTNATLTLQGSASSFYIINVQNTFSLTNANVSLAGGLTWDHVLVNVRNSGTATMVGASTFNGILLATKRNVSLTDTSILSGALIANTVTLAKNSVVKCPGVSP